MYNKSKLDLTNLQPLTCKDFEDCKQNLQFGSISKYTKHDFIRLFLDRLKNIKESNLIGLDTFGYNDLIIGCNHFIDNLIKGGKDIVGKLDFTNGRPSRGGASSFFLR